jgi:hypothetical protein
MTGGAEHQPLLDIRQAVQPPCILLDSEPQLLNILDASKSIVEYTLSHLYALRHEISKSANRQINKSRLTFDA